MAEKSNGFFRTPISYKLPAQNLSSFSFPIEKPLDFLSEINENNLLITNRLKKGNFSKKKPDFLLKSVKKELNTLYEYTLLQQISSKALEKKLKEFENPNLELPGYYQPLIHDFQQKKQKKPFVFMDSLLKNYPLFEEIDPLIMNRALLTLEMNPNNRFSLVNYENFQRFSRILVHRIANIEENSLFITDFFNLAKKEGFLAKKHEIPLNFLNKSQIFSNKQSLFLPKIPICSISSCEIMSLLNKMTEKYSFREKPDELYEENSLKELFLMNLQLSGCFSNEKGLNIKRFRDNLKKGILDYKHFIDLIVGI